MSVREIITEHLDLWTSAVTSKSTAGRGTSSGKRGKIELTGIKKLRELILELAVRGKLVEQDPSDEPASVLLERIAEEKARLVKEGKIKKPKKLPEVEMEEKPFKLPEGWSWARLGNISQINPRNDAYEETVASFIPMPLVSTSYHGEHGQEKRPWGEIKKGYTHFAEGDIAIAKITPCFENSKAAVFRNLENGIGAGTTELHVARPYGETLNPFFILLCLKSPRFLSAGEGKMTGSAGQKRVPKDFFSGVPLPLPPLTEQHRIVEKVDELMSLCDRLEQQVGDQLEAHEVLVDTLLGSLFKPAEGSLTRSADAAELAENWTRIAEHFDTLFTTEASIEKLKQTILQLAVMGRLVEQDPNDEPASVLLERIAEEKAQLVKEGKIRKQKPLPEIAHYEHPFEIPTGWVISRMDDLTDIQSGIAKGKKLSGKRATWLPYLRVANVQRGRLDLSEVKEIEIACTEVERYSVKKRDLLITEGGDWDKVGRTAIWNAEIDPMAHQNHVFRSRLILEEQNEKWIEKYLNSGFARNYFSDSSKQTTNLASINKTQLRSCTVPIPPLEEQQRITEKVDELIALCDHLKARLGEAGETRTQLAEAVVEQAVTT
ncbi:restriction endonuclease subunit S [Halomonas ventosae]|uniref:Type I restriction enzyme S subunit n=1 Tax=Halomonas ventosae TaxID=229007 RepID=A0A2T0VR26_9GAMM|nr:restriction endonuclease subunit S [Halomonas ventosae]PRY72997.1 type I restriction enzyme S subunit [Halomonas ventosae]